MKELGNAFKMIDSLTKAYAAIPHKAATVAVNFSKERFRRGNWLDERAEAWKARKRNDSGKRGKRGILIDSGRLKRSIRKGRVTHNSAIILAGGNGINYAQIHNEGGLISGVFKVKRHTRQAHQRKRNNKAHTVKAHTVKAHSRRVNFNMPKRQFIGNSRELDSRIKNMMLIEIEAALTK